MAKSADASVVVEARLSTGKFEGDVKQLEARLEQLRQKAEQPYEQNGVIMTGDWHLSKEEQQEYDNISSQLDIIHQKEKEILQEKSQQTRESQRQAQEQTKIAEQTTYQLSEERQLRLQIEEMLNNLNIISSKKIISDEDIARTDEMKNDIRQMALEYKQLTGKSLQIKGITDLNTQLSQVTKQLKDTNNTLGGIVKKVSHWALAIFGVRSMYMFLRQEMSAIGQYNKQMGADVDYMRFALANALQPVIQNIIDLAYKLLVYISYIAKAWFGVNIFANATSKAFEKAQKSMGGTTKKAKELQKTLAGFDEMNILNSPNKGGGGGASGIALPSMDLSEWQSVEIPEWIKWIAKNRDLIIGFFRDLGIAIATFKIASFIAKLTGIFDILGSMTGIIKWIAGSGIIIILAGIYNTISSIIAFIIDPSWSNFLGILGGISTILTGIGITLLAINTSNPLGWVLTAIGGIATLTVTILDLIDTLIHEKEHTNSLEEAEKSLDETRKRLKQSTDAYVNAVDYAEQAEKELAEVQKKNKISVEELLSQMEKEHKTYKELEPAQREVYKAYVKNKNAQEDLEEQTGTYKDALHDEADGIAAVGLETAKASGNYDEFKKSVMEAYDQGKLSALEAGAWIQEAMWNMDDAARIAFVQDIPNDIMYALSTATYSKKWKEFKQWWDDNLESLNSEVYIQVKTTASESKGKKSYKGGTGKPYAKGGIYIPPKLAVGGVINQPGRGIPLGSAIGGEAGAEGVIPLTDSQQMELLGEAIGRYISINLTNITELDGRQIARKVDKVRNNENFVMNR